ncbi:MAG: carboxypeptidase regulatory-like domain-containing protein [Candidatus Acidiferrales bacterium]
MLKANGHARILASRFTCAGLFFSVLLCVPSGFARQSSPPPQVPTASISGNVTAAAGDGASNSLAGIPVELAGKGGGSTTQTTLTDRDGHYKFAGLRAGTYILGVTASGFKTWSTELTLGAAQATVQNAVLLLKVVEENMSVTGDAVDVATQSATPSATVSEQRLETLPLHTGKFTEALAVSPGVIQTQQGQLNFNGQSESQGMLLLDSAENVDPVTGNFAIPISVGAIQSMNVFSTPDSAAYGGFSGGLTTIELKPPIPVWNFKMFDFIPSFRAKNDHIVGFANMTPRLEFGGPLIKNKLNVLEEITYEFRRDPIHGLSWPYNETYTHSFLSFTEFQYTFSPKHML